jgi:AraC-like DNA-binding protein
MTGLSPVEFIRNIRLKHACRMLENQSTSVAEVAYKVGFSDPNYFALCFKTEFGTTPSDYRKREFQKTK